MSSSNNSPESTYNPINQLLKKSLRKSFLKEKKIPKNIGPYELKEKITNGSYCKIYLAKSKYTGDKVAIKVINKIYLLEIMEDLLLIKRQLEILKVIKHRNILTLYEIYKNLLNDREREYFENYYFEDYSLQEIADNFKVSKSYVGKFLNGIEDKLNNYEESLNINSKNNKIRELIKDSDLKDKIEELL